MKIPSKDQFLAITIDALLKARWLKIAGLILLMVRPDDLRFIRRRAALLVIRRQMGHLSLRQFVELVTPLAVQMGLLLSPCRDAQFCALLAFMNTDGANSLVSSLDSTYPPIKLIVAETQLRCGQYEAGFRSYLSRIDCDADIWPSALRTRLLVRRYQRWAGESLAGKEVVLLTEGGHGDMIMLARFLNRIDDPSRIVGLIYPAIMGLFERNFPHIRWLTSEQIHEIPPPSGNVFVIMPFDLPSLFGVTNDATLMSPAYLRPSVDLVDSIKRNLQQKSAVRVGLCWRGNPGSVLDGLRSIDLRQLAPILQVPGIDFYSLTLGVDLRRTEGISDLSPLLDSFDETAAALACMDLLISVDTAVAHLAGALGVPVWILLHSNADWRWGRIEGHTLWYKSACLFRQDDESQWGPVVLRVRNALLDFVQS